ncbi:MAG: hypothetical protein ABFR62_12930 [Bacteroidota bacterium]
MIYKFRVVLDLNDEDVFRDIEIEEGASFEDLHNSIVQACELDGQQMASFFISNDTWEQKDEITLFDMSDGPKTEDAKKVMSDWALHELVNEKEHKLLYIYDFFSMWTFYVELLDIMDVEAGVDYPRMVASVGLFPEDAPEKEFTADVNPKELDNFDVFDGDDTFDQAGYDDFNEDWN